MKHLRLHQEEKLRLAILDYLQRYHPDDTETYTMVSLYFSMNRQIASMLENTARKHLVALKGKSIGNSKIPFVVLLQIETKWFVIAPGQDQHATECE